MEPYFYEIEDRRYPVIILGSDRFLDVFPKPRPPEQLELPYILEVMTTAHQHGVGGFDVNPVSHNVVEAFGVLKRRYGDAVVGIGDPNWRCGYKLRGTDIMDMERRVIRTIVEQYMDEASKSLIARLPEKNRRFWFEVDSSAPPLSHADIDGIYIDEEVWLPRIERLSSLCNFCLFGAHYADWMVCLGRQDLLVWQVDSIRDAGMIPVSVCHWTSLTLPKLDGLLAGAHWTLGNLEAMYLSTSEAIAAVQRAKKPVTCFRVLRGISIPEEIEKALKWLRGHVGASSLVIGVDNVHQARQTFSIASSVIRAENPS